MRKILITGGAGFIGSSLADKLLENSDNYIVVADNLLTGNKEKLPQVSEDQFKFINCDVNRYSPIASVMQSYQFDYVFHYAAVVGVKRTLANPVMVLDDIKGIKNVLDLCKNTGVKRVFYASSSEVYGESVTFPQNEETTPLNSRLPYAIVKNVGEAFCRSYKKEYGLDYTIFRFFNTYGPKQSIDFVISKFIKAALKNEPITIYGDGKQSRTFCSIEDNVGACINAFEQNKFVNDVINIGNDKEYSVLELAKIIKEITNSNSEILFNEALPEGDMQRRKPDISKMKLILNKNLIELKEGLKEVIKSKYIINE